MLNMQMYHVYNDSGNTFADIYGAWVERYHSADSLAFKEECSHVLATLSTVSIQCSSVVDALDCLLDRLSSDNFCGDASLRLLQQDIFMKHYYFVG